MSHENGLYYSHNCKKEGFHRLGVPRFIDNKKRKFFRLCKSCEYAYVAEIVVIGDRVKVVKQSSEPDSMDGERKSD